MNFERKLFVDAYVAMFGPPKKKAEEVYRNCRIAGDEGYIKEVTRWHREQCVKAFWED